MSTLKKNQENSKYGQIAPIAIVGMAGIFPQAENLQHYWTNIMREVNCITEVPPSRWSVDDYYDPDPHTPDKTYSKHGGFIPDVPFDPDGIRPAAEFPGGDGCIPTAGADGRPGCPGGRWLPGKRQRDI